MKQHMKSMAGNFHYLFRELYAFKKYSVLFPFLGSLFRILLALITIWMPKLVLELVERRASLYQLFWGILFGGGGLLIVSVIDALAHNRLECCSQIFFFTVLKAKWEEKMMDLDYEIFVSPEGKCSAEKARNAVSSPNMGVVSYPGRVTGLLESLGGIFALGTVVGMIHPALLFLVVTLFAIELWYGGLSEKRKALLQQDRARANRKLNYLAYHTRGIREGKDIRIYSMTDWLRRAAREAVQDKDRVEECAANEDFKKMVLNGIFVFLRNGCAYACLIWQYFHSGMAMGDFILSFSAVTGLGSFLGQLAQSCSEFLEADHYVSDFRQFMNLNTEKQEKKYSVDTLGEAVSFVWENVSFSYREEDEKGGFREIPVLQNISLVMEAGEKLAIVGENGAGKTTFVKLLCGLLRPTKGRILVNGMDVAGFEGEEYRRLFSAVFQKSGILPVSVYDNIVLNAGDTAHSFDSGSGQSETEASVLCRKEASGTLEEENCQEAVWRCVRLAKLDGKLRSLPEGLDTPLGKHMTGQGTELSGGEQQRLLLARALYRNAPVLILDEPTAALDPIAENEIYQDYNRLTEGKTSVFISHRLASTRFCDRILVMEKGKIIETGTHEELMEKRGRYEEMFRVQSKYYAV